MSMGDVRMIGALTFYTVRVRVPDSGEVRLPGEYAHDFASSPMAWRTVRSVSKYVEFPMLDPSSLRALRKRSDGSSAVSGDEWTTDKRPFEADSRSE